MSNPRSSSKTRSGKRRSQIREELRRSTTLGRIQKAIEQINYREQRKPGQTEAITRALRRIGFKQDIIEEAYEHFLAERGQLEVKCGTPLTLDRECIVRRTLDPRLLGSEPVVVNGSIVEGWPRKRLQKKLRSVEFPFRLRVRRDLLGLPPDELPLTKEAVKERTLLTLEKQQEDMFKNLVVLMHNQSAANRKDPTMKLLSKNSRKAINSLHWVNKHLKVQVNVDQLEKSNREIYSDLVGVRNGLGQLPAYTRRMFDLITNSWEQDRKEQMLAITSIVVDTQLAHNYGMNVDVALIIAAYSTPYGMPSPKIPDKSVDWYKRTSSARDSDVSWKRLSTSRESKSEEDSIKIEEKKVTPPPEPRRAETSMFSRLRSGKLLAGLRGRRWSK